MLADEVKVLVDVEFAAAVVLAVEQNIVVGVGQVMVEDIELHYSEMREPNAHLNMDFALVVVLLV